MEPGQPLQRSVLEKKWHRVSYNQTARISRQTIAHERSSKCVLCTPYVLLGVALQVAHGELNSHCMGLGLWTQLFGRTSEFLSLPRIGASTKPSFVAFYGSFQEYKAFKREPSSSR